MTTSLTVPSQTKLLNVLLSEWVHLGLAIMEKIIVYYLFQNDVSFSYGQHKHQKNSLIVCLLWLL